MVFVLILFGGQMNILQKMTKTVKITVHSINNYTNNSEYTNNGYRDQKLFQ